MRSMLLICEQFACDFDVKFNSLKSTVMHIGEGFDVRSAPLMLNGCKLQCVKRFQYLGVYILAGTHFKCCVNIAVYFYSLYYITIVLLNSLYYVSRCITMCINILCYILGNKDICITYLFSGEQYCIAFCSLRLNKVGPFSRNASLK